MTRTLNICRASDLHPYECGGGCLHCRAERTKTHNPRQCWLCWDGDPKNMPGPAVTVPSGKKMRDRAIAKMVNAAKKAMKGMDPNMRVEVIAQVAEWHRDQLYHPE